MALFGSSLFLPCLPTIPAELLLTDTAAFSPNSHLLLVVASVSGIKRVLGVFFVPQALGWVFNVASTKPGCNTWGLVRDYLGPGVRFVGMGVSYLGKIVRL